MVNAIALGGQLASLVSQVSALEAKRVAVDRELQMLRPLPRAPPVLENRLAEWRRVLRGSVTQARTVLQRVLRASSSRGERMERVNDFAGQSVGVTQVGERIWLVTFMHYDLGYFDDETCRLEPIENPFGPKVLPVRSE